MAVAYFMPWFISSSDYKLSVFARTLTGENLGVNLKGFLYALTHILVTLVYTSLPFIELKKFRSADRSLSPASEKRLKFLVRFNGVFLSYWVFQLIGLITITIVQYYVYQIDYVLALMNSLLIQTLSFYLLFKSGFLYAHPFDKKYKGSSLTADKHDVLLNKIQTLVIKEELFLDSELTLQKVSDLLSVNKSYLSQVVNQEFGCGFTDFINDYRIRKAKELLEDPQNSQIKLLGIAMDSGFNNTTSFTRVFKKYMGVTPSEYRKSKIII